MYCQILYDSLCVCVCASCTSSRAKVASSCHSSSDREFKSSSLQPQHIWGKEKQCSELTAHNLSIQTAVPTLPLLRMVPSAAPQRHRGPEKKSQIQKCISRIKTLCVHYRCLVLKMGIKPGWLNQRAEVKQKLASGVLYKSTDIIIMRSPVFSEGWLFLLWANALNCSMQMRAITKLLGEAMTAEVGFIGGLTQLSWQPHRIS